MCSYTACCKLTLTMASKRARKADYTSSEIATLVRLFVENHDRLVGRFSNDLTHAQKVKIYENIKEQVNAVSTTERSLESIKDKWQTIKKALKQKLSNILAKKKKDVRRTGGGEPEVVLTDDDVARQLTDIEMLVYPLIPMESIAGKNRTLSPIKAWANLVINRPIHDC